MSGPAPFTQLIHALDDGSGLVSVRAVLDIIAEAEAICPEDYGFEEWIKALEKKVAAASEKQSSMPDPEAIGAAFAVARWCVEHEGECLGDHPEVLKLAQEALNAANR